MARLLQRYCLCLSLETFAVGSLCSLRSTDVFERQPDSGFIIVKRALLADAASDLDDHYSRSGTGTLKPLSVVETRL